MADYDYIPGRGYSKRIGRGTKPAKRFSKEWWCEQRPSDWYPRWKRWRNNIVTTLAMGTVLYVLGYKFYTDALQVRVKNELLERCAVIHNKECELRTVVVPVDAPVSKAVFLNK